MNKEIPIIGKNIIEMLMFNMYDECKVIYREYIQNSYDAIQQAVENGILSSVSDGIVTVTIDKKHRNVIIRDNGTGISVSKAPSTLLNIAASEKDGISQAGQYGVGRLVGAGFCSRVIFRTRSVGENECTQVVINSEEAHRIIRDKNDHSDAITVMSRISNVSLIEDEESHFFEVTLEGIKEEFEELLLEQSIRSYLSAVAPVDYSFQFKNMLINKNPEFKDIHSKMKYVQVLVNKKSITKKYGLKVIGTDDEILKLEVFHLKEEDKELAWGWYAVTPFTKAIPEMYENEEEPNRGIRLRKNNIQIGDAKLLDKFFSEARGNHYFYGEIHVTSKDIVPDSSRQGLASTHEALRLYELLREKFSELRQVYYLANNLKQAVRDLKVGQKKMLSDNKVVDKREAEAEIEKAKTTLDKLTKKDLASTTAGLPISEYYKKQSQEKPNGEIDNPEKKKSVSKQTKIVSNDELSSLVDKYSNDNIRIIRKIFALLRHKWESDNKATLERLIADIIKSLRK